MLYNIFTFFTKKKCYICIMAGIYIHIPFCKTRCIYCGFYSTTSLERREEYVEKVCSELKTRKDYLRNEPIDTIYFGGGTPSQLSVLQIEKILNSVYNINNVRARAEITLEANPDDLSLQFLKDIKSIGINRLSMGVQSFSDEKLRFIRRRHTSSQAKSAVLDAAKVGFSNINIDLMFGFPSQIIEEWGNDVSEALKLPVQHISAYSLMYDEGTLLEQMLSRGDIEEIDDELSLQMYKLLVLRLAESGYEHYEISNFCLPGYKSRHNSGYWSGVPYLGVGAGAHSYDGDSRQYNVDSLDEYMKGAVQVKEELSCEERYNEYVFTGLRTCEGISLTELEKKFGQTLYDYCLKNAKRHIDMNNLIREKLPEAEVLKLSSEGVFISNDIMSDLMWINED